MLLSLSATVGLLCVQLEGSVLSESLLCAPVRYDLSCCLLWSDTHSHVCACYGAQRGLSHPYCVRMLEGTRFMGLPCACAWLYNSCITAWFPFMS
jgi:hypothetical protein